MGLMEKTSEVIAIGKKWWQEKDGSESALRILVVPAGWTGITMALAGVVAMFLNIDQATVAMTTGVGLVGTAMAAKAWQKGKE